MGKREKMTEERKRSDSQCCATRRKNAPELCPPLQKKKRNRKKKPQSHKTPQFPEIYDDTVQGCLSSQLRRFIYGYFKFLPSWKIVAETGALMNAAARPVELNRPESENYEAVESREACGLRVADD